MKKISTKILIEHRCIIVQVKAEYIADFNPSMYVKSAKLAHTYVLIPDQGSISDSPGPVYQGQPPAELDSFISSLHNVSEWMAVSKEMFDFTGSTCNKIGIGYAGFRYQNDKCTTPVGRYKHKTIN